MALMLLYNFSSIVLGSKARQTNLHIASREDGKELGALLVVASPCTPPNWYASTIEPLQCPPFTPPWPRWFCLPCAWICHACLTGTIRSHSIQVKSGQFDSIPSSTATASSIFGLAHVQSGTKASNHISQHEHRTRSFAAGLPVQ